jgi:outer membrane protein TolC
MFQPVLPRLVLLLSSLVLGGHVLAQTRCNEDDASSPANRPAKDASLLETGSGDPRAQLQELVHTALTRSRAVGALRLITMAAEADLEEAKAQRLPSVNLGGSFAHIGQMERSTVLERGLQGKASLTVGAPIYDSGRITKLTEWRLQLADAARYGQVNAEEQVALQTVTLALDRGRYQLQAQVYQQYVRKMACLVDALEIITKADRGRSSELVQAQKSLQQAELSYEQTTSALRQTEVRLKRFVGDELPRAAGMSAVLARLPDLAEMQSDVLQAPDVAQATATAQAQRAYAESVQASQKPSVSLLVSGNTSIGPSTPGPNGPQLRHSDWVGGVTVNIPLFQPGANSALTSAQRRAQAASLQREDTIEAKRYRVQEMFEAASSSLDRARRVVEILRNSDRVRASTLQQWQQLGRRSLFDVMAAEGDYYSMRVAHVNALYDAQQVVAIMWSLGRGVMTPLR